MKLLLTLLFLQYVSTESSEFYTFKVPDIKGNEVDFSQYKGTVVLVVNVASQCGHTDSHYKAMKRLQDILGYDKKFTILAFPCNNFNEQEPWENQEIEEFVRGHYKADFPLFGKVDIIGENAIPLYKWITKQSTAPEWNFHKYLIDTEGNIIKNWASGTTVETIFDEIHSLIKKNDSGESSEDSSKEQKQEL